MAGEINAVVREGGKVSGSHVVYLGQGKLAENEAKPIRNIFSSEKDEYTRRQAENYLSGDKGAPQDGSIFEFFVSPEGGTFEKLGATQEEREAAFQASIRNGLEKVFAQLGISDVRYIATIHQNTNHQHAHILLATDVTNESGEKEIFNGFPRAWLLRNNKSNSTVGEIFAESFQANISNIPFAHVQTNVTSSDLSLPKKIERNSDRWNKVVESYCETRRINPQLLEEVIDNGSVYINGQGGVTFVRRDARTAEPTGYTNESGSTSAKDENGFFYIGDPGSATRFLVVDNPKEALAIWELTSSRDLSRVCIVTADDGRAPENFTKFLNAESQQRSMRVIWALGLDRDNQQNKKFLPELTDSLLTDRDANAPALEVVSIEPKSAYGRTWTNQIQWRNAPGKLQAFVKNIASSESSREDAKTLEAAQLETEETKNRIATSTLFDRVTTRLDGEDFVVVEKRGDGLGRELGTYRLDFDAGDLPVYRLTTLAGEKVGERVTFEAEAEAISHIETEFISAQESLLVAGDLEAETEIETAPAEDFSAQETETVAASEVIAAPIPRGRSIQEITESVRDLRIDEIAPLIGLFYRSRDKRWIDQEGKNKNFKIKTLKNQPSNEPQVWNDEVNGFKGSIGMIDLVSHVTGYSFIDARNFLFDYYAPRWKDEIKQHYAFLDAQRDARRNTGSEEFSTIVVDSAQTAGEAENAPEKAVKLKLPTRNERSFDEIYTYLTDRAISASWLAVETYLKNIYPSQYGTPVFVHRSPEGDITGASWRAIKNVKRDDAPGSDLNKGWFHLGDMWTAERYVIVRDPIEALSYATIHEKDKRMARTAVIALGYRSKDIPEGLYEFIHNRYGATLVLALEDSTSAENIYFDLQEKAGLIGQLHNRELHESFKFMPFSFNGKIEREKPHGLDWNDTLKAAEYEARKAVEQEDYVEMYAQSEAADAVAAEENIASFAPESQPEKAAGEPVYAWARYAADNETSYEISSAGDRRFSAINAELADGRSIEEAYQLDVKGYAQHPLIAAAFVEGKTFKDIFFDKKLRDVFKGAPPLVDLDQDETESRNKLFGEYMKLWREWATENPQLVQELANNARGKVLTDKFASTENNQARALATLLNEMEANGEIVLRDQRPANEYITETLIPRIFSHQDDRISYLINSLREMSSMDERFAPEEPRYKERVSREIQRLERVLNRLETSNTPESRLELEKIEKYYASNYATEFRSPNEPAEAINVKVERIKEFVMSQLRARFETFETADAAARISYENELSQEEFNEENEQTIDIHADRVVADSNLGLSGGQRENDAPRDADERSSGVAANLANDGAGESGIGHAGAVDGAGAVAGVGEISDSESESGDARRTRSDSPELRSAADEDSDRLGIDAPGRRRGLETGSAAGDSGAGHGDAETVLSGNGSGERLEFEEPKIQEFRYLTPEEKAVLPPMSVGQTIYGNPVAISENAIVGSRWLNSYNGKTYKFLGTYKVATTAAILFDEVDKVQFLEDFAETGRGTPVYLPIEEGAEIIVRDVQQTEVVSYEAIRASEIEAILTRTFAERGFNDRITLTPVKDATEYGFENPDQLAFEIDIETAGGGRKIPQSGSYAPFVVAQEGGYLSLYRGVYDPGSYADLQPESFDVEYIADGADEESIAEILGAQILGEFWDNPQGLADSLKPVDYSDLLEEKPESAPVVFANLGTAELTDFYQTTPDYTYRQFDGVISAIKKKRSRDGKNLFLRVEMAGAEFTHYFAFGDRPSDKNDRAIYDAIKNGDIKVGDSLTFKGYVNEKLENSRRADLAAGKEQKYNSINCYATEIIHQPVLAAEASNEKATETAAEEIAGETAPQLVGPAKEIVSENAAVSSVQEVETAEENAEVPLDLPAIEMDRFEREILAGDFEDPDDVNPEEMRSDWMTQTISRASAYVNLREELQQPVGATKAAKDERKEKIKLLSDLESGLANDIYQAWRFFGDGTEKYLREIVKDGFDLEFNPENFELIKRRVVIFDLTAKPEPQAAEAQSENAQESLFEDSESALSQVDRELGFETATRAILALDDYFEKTNFLDFEFDILRDAKDEFPANSIVVSLADQISGKTELGVIVKPFRDEDQYTFFKKTDDGYSSFEQIEFNELTAKITFAYQDFVSENEQATDKTLPESENTAEETTPAQEIAQVEDLKPPMRISLLGAPNTEETRDQIMRILARDFYLGRADQESLAFIKEKWLKDEVLNQKFSNFGMEIRKDYQNDNLTTLEMELLEKAHLRAIDEGIRAGYKMIDGEYYKMVDETLRYNELTDTFSSADNEKVVARSSTPYRDSWLANGEYLNYLSDGQVMMSLYDREPELNKQSAAIEARGTLVELEIEKHISPTTARAFYLGELDAEELQFVKDNYLTNATALKELAAVGAELRAAYSAGELSAEDRVKIEKTQIRAIDMQIGRPYEMVEGEFYQLDGEYLPYDGKDDCFVKENGQTIARSETDYSDSGIEEGAYMLQLSEPQIVLEYIIRSQEDSFARFADIIGLPEPEVKELRAAANGRARDSYESLAYELREQFAAKNRRDIIVEVYEGTEIHDLNNFSIHLYNEAYRTTPGIEPFGKVTRGTDSYSYEIGDQDDELFSVETLAAAIIVAETNKMAAVATGEVQLDEARESEAKAKIQKFVDFYNSRYPGEIAYKSFFGSALIPPQEVHFVESTLLVKNPELESGYEPAEFKRNGFKSAEELLTKLTAPKSGGRTSFDHWLGQVANVAAEENSVDVSTFLKDIRKNAMQTMPGEEYARQNAGAAQVEKQKPLSAAEIKINKFVEFFNQNYPGNLQLNSLPERSYQPPRDVYYLSTSISDAEGFNLTFGSEPFYVSLDQLAADLTAEKETTVFDEWLQKAAQKASVGNEYKIKEFLDSVAQGESLPGREFQITQTAQNLKAIEELSDEIQKPTLERAISSLLGVCDGASSLDGQGFNGVDAGYARHLNSKPEWSRLDAQNANKMLRKYRRQLAGFGIDYEQLAGTIQNYPERFTRLQRNEILLSGNQIQIVFKYNPDLVEKVKKIPTADYKPDGKMKFWTITPTAEALAALDEFIAENDFSVSEIIGDYLENLRQNPVVIEKKQVKAANYSLDSIKKSGNDIFVVEANTSAANMPEARDYLETLRADEGFLGGQITPGTGGTARVKAYYHPNVETVLAGTQDAQEETRGIQRRYVNFNFVQGMPIKPFTPEEIAKANENLIVTDSEPQTAEEIVENLQAAAAQTETPAAAEKAGKIRYGSRLLPDSILNKMTARQDVSGDDVQITAKLFHPMSSYTFFVSEAAPVMQQGKVIDVELFGYVQMNLHERGEWGYSSLKEIESQNILGVKVERDLYFDEGKFGEVYYQFRKQRGMLSAEEIEAENTKRETTDVLTNFVREVEEAEQFLEDYADDKELGETLAKYGRKGADDYDQFSDPLQLLEAGDSYFWQGIEYHIEEVYDGEIVGVKVYSEPHENVTLRAEDLLRAGFIGKGIERRAIDSRLEDEAMREEALAQEFVTLNEGDEFILDDSTYRVLGINESGNIEVESVRLTEVIEEEELRSMGVRSNTRELGEEAQIAEAPERKEEKPEFSDGKTKVSPEDRFNYKGVEIYVYRVHDDETGGIGYYTNQEETEVLSSTRLLRNGFIGEGIDADSINLDLEEGFESRESVTPEKLEKLTPGVTFTLEDTEYTVQNVLENGNIKVTSRFRDYKQLTEAELREMGYKTRELERKSLRPAKSVQPVVSETENIPAVEIFSSGKNAQEELAAKVERLKAAAGNYQANVDSYVELDYEDEKYITLDDHLRTFGWEGHFRNEEYRYFLPVGIENVYVDQDGELVRFRDEEVHYFEFAEENGTDQEPEIFEFIDKAEAIAERGTKSGAFLSEVKTSINNLTDEISVDELLEAESEKQIAAHVEPVEEVRPDNYRFTDLSIHDGGAKEKFYRNVEAMQILKMLESQERFATPEEMDKIAAFVGWGSVKEPFRIPRVQENWQKEKEILLSMMTDREFGEASRVADNAFHTSVKMTAEMWRIVEKLGFKGGRIQEPAVGGGNMLGTMPEGIYKNSKVYGCDVDSSSLKIAQALYPRAELVNSKYEEIKWKDNTFDLAITNVPFGNYYVADTRYRSLNPTIHNYFLLKALDTTRPGGLAVTITSRFTLDAAEPRIREALAQRAELIGAVRLPDDAFKANAGTEVVTDLLVFKKREQPLEIKLDDKGNTLPLVLPEGELNWLQTGEIENPDYNPNNHWSTRQLKINQLYIDNPELVLGEVRGTGRVNMSGDFTVEPTGDFDERFESFISSLPENIYHSLSEKRDQEIQAKLEAKNWLQSGKKAGNYFVEKEKVYQVEPDGTAAAVQMSDRDRKKLEKLLEIKETVTEIYGFEVDGSSESLAQAEKLRVTLNRQYNSFVGDFGAIKEKNNSRLLSGDPDGYRIINLEKSYKQKTKVAEKADIFFRPTISPISYVTTAENISDAVAASLNKYGNLNLNYISRLREQTGEQIEAEFIKEDIAYLNPETTAWETKDVYLSGNVKAKLKTAEEIASRSVEDEKLYKRNVEALTKVIPEDIAHVDIELNLGTSMMTVQDMKDFVRHLTKAGDDEVIVEYAERIGRWCVGWRSNKAARTLRKGEAARKIWGTEDRDAISLIEAILQGKDVTVTRRKTDELGNETTYVDREASSLAEAKVLDIKHEFRNWIWTDAKRAERIHREYNDKRNNTVAWKPDGSHLKLVGLSPSIVPYKHQRDYTWRALQKPSAFAAHEVGTGKTLSMAIAVMEKKRLGQCNKPMLACLKANIHQVTDAARKAYPHARIFSLDEHFNSNSRQDAASIIANNDFDLIIMSYEQVKKLPVSKKTQESYLQGELSELTEAICNAIESEGKKSRMAGQLRRRQRNLEAKIGELMMVERDNAVTFEETGIDKIYVDEAHNFKALPIYTTLQNLKGVPTTRSERAVDLHIRCEYLRGKHGEPRISPATGTPITNTTAEIYNWMRFCAPDKLEENGIYSFDAFAREYTEVVRKLEPTATGTYKVQNRLAKYINLPELRIMMSDFFDVVTADEAGIVRPESKTFIVGVPISLAQMEFRESLQKRAERLGKVDPRVDNYFKISMDGEKMSADMRLVDAAAEDIAENKVGCVVTNALRIAHEQPGSVQMIFADLGVHPSPLTGFSMFDEIERQLVAFGVPADRIANISKIGSKKKRIEAIEKAERGEILFLLGSTKTLGTGVNAQTFVSALHNLDTTWLPESIIQRIGRGVRQGNILAALNRAVEVYNYVTIGGFDEIKWQAVGRKYNFINQVVTNKMVARTFQDRADDGFSPAEIAAVASGNDDVRRQVELSMEVEELTRRSKMFMQNQIEMRNKLPHLQDDTERFNNIAGKFEADYDLYEAKRAEKEAFLVTVREKAEADFKLIKEEIKELKKNPEVDKELLDAKKLEKDIIDDLRDTKFVITLDGAEYVNKKDAAQKLATLFATGSGDRKVGEFYGFDVEIRESNLGYGYDSGRTLFSRKVVLVNPETNFPHEVANGHQDFITRGTLTNFNSTLNNLAWRARSNRSEADRKADEIIRINAKLGEQFRDAELLETSRKELREIEGRLKKFNHAMQRDRELERKIEVTEVGNPNSEQAKDILDGIRDIMEDAAEYTIEIPDFVSKAFTEASMRGIPVAEVQAMYDEREAMGIVESVFSDEENEGDDETEVIAAEDEETEIDEFAEVPAQKSANSVKSAVGTVIEKVSETVGNAIAGAQNNAAELKSAVQFSLFGGNSEDEQVMASLSTSGKFERAAETLRNEPMSKLWFMVGAKSDGNGRVTLNPAGYEIIRQAYETGNIGYKERDFAGTFNEPEGVNKLIASLENMKVSEPYHKATIDELLGTVRRAQNERGGTVTFLRDVKALDHEAIHEGSFYAGKGQTIQDRHGYFEMLVQSPEMQIARGALLKLGYVDNDALLVDELAAHCGSEDYAKLGLTEEQHKNYLRSWFKSIEAKNGRLSLNEFKELNDESEKIRQEVYNDATRRRTRAAESNELKQLAEINREFSERLVRDRNDLAGKSEEIESRETVIDEITSSLKEMLVELNPENKMPPDVLIETVRRENSDKSFVRLNYIAYGEEKIIAEIEPVNAKSSELIEVRRGGQTYTSTFLSQEAYRAVLDHKSARPSTAETSEALEMLLNGAGITEKITLGYGSPVPESYYHQATVEFKRQLGERKSLPGDNKFDILARVTLAGVNYQYESSNRKIITPKLEDIAQVFASEQAVLEPIVESETLRTPNKEDQQFHYKTGRAAKASSNELLEAKSGENRRSESKIHLLKAVAQESGQHHLINVATGVTVTTDAREYLTNPNVSHVEGESIKDDGRYFLCVESDTDFDQTTKDFLNNFDVPAETQKMLLLKHRIVSGGHAHNSLVTTLGGLTDDQKLDDYRFKNFGFADEATTDFLSNRTDKLPQSISSKRVDRFLVRNYNHVNESTSENSLETKSYIYDVNLDVASGKLQTTEFVFDNYRDGDYSRNIRLGDFIGAPGDSRTNEGYQAAVKKLTEAVELSESGAAIPARVDQSSTEVFMKATDNPVVEKAAAPIDTSVPLEVLLGDELVATMNFRQTEFELKELRGKKDSKRYEVTLENGDKKYFSLDYLDRQAGSKGNKALEAQEKAGLVKMRAFSEKTPEWLVKKEIKETAKAAEIVAQSSLRAQIETAHTAAVANLEKKLQEATAYASEARLKVEARAGERTEEKVSPKIDSNTLWKLQEKALKRGDSQGFTALEEIHLESGAVRSNYAAGRLSAVSYLSEINGKSADFRQNELKESGRDKFYKIEIQNGEGGLELKNWSLKAADEKAEADEKKFADRRRDGYRHLLRPVTNQLNPFAPIQGKLSWLTDPVGTLNAHFNPLEVLKNDSGVQTVRAIYKFFDNIKDVEEKQKLAQEKLSDIKSKVETQLENDMAETAVRQNAFSRSADVAKEALRRETELRSQAKTQIEGDEFIKAGNLDMPQARFTSAEIREVQTAATEMQDTEIIEKVMNLLDANPSLAKTLKQTPERTLGQSIMTKAESTAKLNNLVESAKALDYTTGEFTVAGESVEEIGRQLSISDKAQSWIDSLLDKNPTVQPEFSEDEILRLTELQSSLTDETGKALMQIVESSKTAAAQRQITLDVIDSGVSADVSPVSAAEAVQTTANAAQPLDLTQYNAVNGSGQSIGDQIIAQMQPATAANNPLEIAEAIQNAKIQAVDSTEAQWKEFAPNLQELPGTDEKRFALEDEKYNLTRKEEFGQNSSNSLDETSLDSTGLDEDSLSGSSAESAETAAKAEIAKVEEAVTKKAAEEAFEFFL